MMLSKSRNKSQHSFLPVQSSTTLYNNSTLSLLNLISSLRGKRTVSSCELTAPTRITKRVNDNELSKRSPKKSFDNIFKWSRTNFSSPSKKSSFKDNNFMKGRLDKFITFSAGKKKKGNRNNLELGVAQTLARKFMKKGKISFQSTFYFKNANHAKKKIMNDFSETTTANNLYSSQQNYQEYLTYLEKNKKALAKNVKRIARIFNKAKAEYEQVGVINKPFVKPTSKLSLIIKPFTNEALKCSNKVYLRKAYNHIKKREIEKLTNQAANEVMEIESKEYQALNHCTMKSNTETVNRNNLLRQVKLLSILANHYDYDKDDLLEHDYEQFREQMNEIDYEKYKALKDMKPGFLKKAFKKQTLKKFKQSTGNYFALPVGSQD